MRESFNTLVISDLHLGEDLTIAASETTRRNLAVVEEQLAEFIQYYTTRRRDSRAWRLVINGDMIDFLAVCLRPGDAALDDLDAGARSSEEVRFGLGRREIVAQAKVRAVVARHREVFRAMAQFLAVGNRVEIVCGNHDIELHWAAVQDELRTQIQTVWTSLAASRRPGAPSAAQIGEHVGFHGWYFYEPGVAWIEHGHQYDECCSFDFALEPVGPDGEHIDVNVDVAGLSYVSNRIDGAEPHALAEWTAGGYVRLGMQLGLTGGLGLAKGYYLFVASLLRIWRSHAPRAAVNRARRARHVARRRALAADTGVNEDGLRAIDELHRRPVVSNIRRLMRVLMLDRVLVNVLAVVVTLIALVALPLWASMAVAGASYGFSRAAGRRIARRRVGNSEVSLGLAPERILRHVDAKYVVFGHTHEPVAQKLDAGRWYFNGGTWMPVGKPGLLRAFTHVVIKHGEHGPSATLCQWRDGASRAFTPGWVPARVGSFGAIGVVAAEPVEAQAA